jgi:hypothetical protein
MTLRLERFEYLWAERLIHGARDLARRVPQSPFEE